MRRLNARFFVSMGLVSLLASVMLLAMYLDYIPDPHAIVRKGRAALAETIAASTSILISQSDVKSAEAVLQFTVKRNPDLLSAAVVKADGKTVAVIGKHVDYGRGKVLAPRTLPLAVIEYLVMGNLTCPWQKRLVRSVQAKLLPLHPVEIFWSVFQIKQFLLAHPLIYPFKSMICQEKGLCPLR